MGRVLRVLVCVILVLSVGALVLAIMLFNRRELLIGRTHMLEEQIIGIAKFIEAKGPDEQVQPRYEAKDTSPVTSKELENPERSPFWDTYNYKLEVQNLPTIQLDNDEKRRQLREYYKIGKDGKVERDLNGKPSTKGPMREVLDSVLDRVREESTTLNKTREQLTKLREELADTIKDYNQLKKDGRADKKTIEEKQAQIEKLQEDIRKLNHTIEGLQEEKVALTAEVAEAKNEIAKQKDQITEMDKTIKKLTKDLEDARGRTRTQRDQAQQGTAVQLPPGDKGKIVAVDNTLKFVVAELSDTMMTELLGANREGPLPQVELMVRRPGMKSAAGEFVTRIRLRQVLRQKNLVVADILIDWQQVPVEKDDVVFF